MEDFLKNYLRLLAVFLFLVAFFFPLLTARFFFFAIVFRNKFTNIVLQ